MLNILFTSQVSQDLPFLHPSETSVLNRLSKLGSDYIRFTEFIEQHTGHVHQQVGVCWASAVRAPSPWKQTFLNQSRLVFSYFRVFMLRSQFKSIVLCSRCRNITQTNKIRQFFMGSTYGLSAPVWTPCCSRTDRPCWTWNKR